MCNYQYSCVSLREISWGKIILKTIKIKGLQNKLSSGIGCGLKEHHIFTKEKLRKPNNSVINKQWERKRERERQRETLKHWMSRSE